MHIVYLIVNTTLSVMGALFAVWIFWRGLKNSEDPAKVLFKMGLSAVLVTLEVLFARHMIGQLHEGDGNQWAKARISDGEAAVMFTNALRQCVPPVHRHQLWARQRSWARPWGRDGSRGWRWSRRGGRRRR